MRSLFVSIILVCSFFSFAQSNYCSQELYPFRGSNKMMGYVNVQKEWVIQPFFDKASTFTGNMALVQRKGKIGAVNCDGKLIIRCEYDELTPFLGGRAWYRKGAKWGLIKDDGKILLLPKYDEIKEIAKYTDQTWVKLNGLWGIYDKYAEKMVWEPQFSSYKQTIDAKYSFVQSDFSSGLIRVDTQLVVLNNVFVSHNYKKRKYIVSNNKGRAGLVAYNGKVIIPISNDSIVYSKERYIVHNNGDVSLHSLYGKKIKSGFDAIYPFNNRFIAKVKKGDKVNYITRKGRAIFKGAYKSLEYVAEHNNFIAEGKEGYMLLSASEKQLTESTYRWIKKGKGFFVGAETSNEQYLISVLGKVSEDFYRNVMLEDTVTQIRVQDYESKKYGFYDFASLSYKTDLIYDELGSIKNGISIFSLNGKYGVLNSKYDTDIKNQDEIDVVYTSASKPYLITTLNGLKGVLSHDLRVVLIQGYNQIKYEDGYFLVTNLKGKLGVFSTAGKEIIPVENSKIISLSEGKFAVSKKGKTYLIYNNRGKALYGERAFDDVKRIGYNSIPVKKDGLWGYINKKNGKQVVDFLYLDAEPYAEVNGVGKAKVIKQTKETVYLNLRGREER